jgi:hypothetical protein
MKEFLRKIKLVDNLTTHLKMSQQDFANKLSAITEEKKIGLFSNSFEAFSSNNAEFVGYVNFDSFKLKRRVRLFEPNHMMAVANGTFVENNRQLTIETEINGLSRFMILIYCLLIIIYSIVITVSIASSDKVNSFFVLFIFVQGSLVFSIPYLIMKRNVKRFKYELEREFYYLTKE